MQSKYDEYKGHRIELRPSQREERTARDPAPDAPDLFIDEARVRYGQHPTGEYYLNDYAYEPTPDLIELARKFIDRSTQTGEARRAAARKDG